MEKLGLGKLGWAFVAFAVVSNLVTMPPGVSGAGYLVGSIVGAYLLARLLGLVKVGLYRLGASVVARARSN